MEVKTWALRDQYEFAHFRSGDLLLCLTVLVRDGQSLLRRYRTSGVHEITLKTDVPTCFPIGVYLTPSQLLLYIYVPTVHVIADYAHSPTH